MAFVSSGPISLSNLNSEMGVATTSNVSLVNTVTKGILSKLSGSFSMSELYGKTYVKQNVVPNSRDLYVWLNSGGAVATNCSYSRDTTTTTPAGGVPVKMIVNANDPHIQCYNSSYWNLASALKNQTWTFSLYVKADRSTYFQPFIFGVDASGNAFAANCNIAATNIAVSTSWSRIEFTFTFTGTSVRYIQVRFDGYDTAPVGTTYWFDGAQVEQRILATPLI